LLRAFITYGGLGGGAPGDGPEGGALGDGPEGGVLVWVATGGGLLPVRLPGRDPAGGFGRVSASSCFAGPLLNTTR